MTESIQFEIGYKEKTVDEIYLNGVKDEEDYNVSSTTGLSSPMGSPNQSDYRYKESVKQGVIIDESEQDLQAFIDSGLSSPSMTTSSVHKAQEHMSDDDNESVATTVSKNSKRICKTQVVSNKVTIKTRYRGVMNLLFKKYLKQLGHSDLCPLIATEREKKGNVYNSSVAESCYKIYCEMDCDDILTKKNKQRLLSHFEDFCRPEILRVALAASKAKNKANGLWMIKNINEVKKAMTKKNHTPSFSTL